MDSTRRGQPLRICTWHVYIWRGRDSAVCIATRYGLDGPGIESRWGRDFSHPSRPALGPTMDIGSFPGVKRPGRGVDHPPPSSAEVEGRVEQYIYFPSGPSWPVIGRTLLYIYILNRITLYWPTIYKYVSWSRGKRSWVCKECQCDCGQCKFSPDSV